MSALRTMVIAGSLLVAAGCGDDLEIRHFKIPKEVPAPPKAAEDRQLIAAIIPNGDRTWFFKLVGPGPRVRAEQGRLETFIASLRFGSDLPTWVLPERWTATAETGMRAATIRIATSDPPLEMTVVKLGRDGQASNIPANINRWREQLELPPLPESRISDVTRPAKTADGSDATLVSLSTGGGAAPAPTPPPATTSPGPRAPIHYSAPSGWTSLPASGMRVAAFRIAEGDREGEVTIIPLGGAAGSLLGNVNRWRGQVGLEPIAESKLDSEMAKIAVNGLPATYLDFSGPKGRILAVILVRGDTTWFFKAQGPAELLEVQRATFDQFVRSVTFDP